MTNFKKTIIICSILITILGVLFCIIHFTNSPTSNLIDNQDTAVQIASALIKENYPDWHDGLKDILHAKKNGDIWVVSPNFPDHMKAPTLYVHISAKDGRILHHRIHP